MVELLLAYVISTNFLLSLLEPKENKRVEEKLLTIVLAKLLLASTTTKFPCNSPLLEPKETKLVSGDAMPFPVTHLKATEQSHHLYSGDATPFPVTQLNAAEQNHHLYV